MSSRTKTNQMILDNIIMNKITSFDGDNEPADFVTLPNTHKRWDLASQFRQYFATSIDKGETQTISIYKAN